MQSKAQFTRLPNPASDRVIVEWTVSNSSFNFYEAFGSVIASIQLKPLFPISAFDISGGEAGVYAGCFRNNQDNMIKKLII